MSAEISLPWGDTELFVPDFSVVPEEKSVVAEEEARVAESDASGNGIETSGVSDDFMQTMLSIREAMDSVVSERSSTGGRRIVEEEERQRKMPGNVRVMPGMREGQLGKGGTIWASKVVVGKDRSGKVVEKDIAPGFADPVWLASFENKEE